MHMIKLTIFLKQHQKATSSWKTVSVYSLKVVNLTLINVNNFVVSFIVANPTVHIVLSTDLHVIDDYAFAENLRPDIFQVKIHYHNRERYVEILNIWKFTQSLR